jgi:hypothetical protein
MTNHREAGKFTQTLMNRNQFNPVLAAARPLDPLCGVRLLESKPSLKRI